jgi:hypothetical protein
MDEPMNTPMMRLASMHSMDALESIDQFFGILHKMMKEMFERSKEKPVLGAFPADIIFILYCKQVGEKPDKVYDDEGIAQEVSKRYAQAIKDEVTEAGKKYDMDIDFDGPRDVFKVVYPRNNLVMAARPFRPPHPEMN